MDQFDDLNTNSPSPQETFKPPSMFQITFDKLVHDMKFVGMFTIIYGAFECITIIGALIGVPTIIIGLRMRESAEQFYMYKMTNNPAALRQGFELQAKYFHLIKILIIIGLILTALYIVLIIILFSIGFSQLFSGTPSFQSS